MKNKEKDGQVNGERILAYKMSQEFTEADLRAISGAVSLVPKTFGPVTTRTGSPGGGTSDSETTVCADWTD